MKKFLFSLPLVSKAAMKFYAGSAIFMPSGTVVVLNNDGTPLATQRVLAVNASAVNHSFAGVLSIQETVDQLSKCKTIEQFIAARPVVTREQKFHFGGIYTYVPGTIEFIIRQVGNNEPIFTMDGVQLLLPEVNMMAEYLNGAMTFGTQRVGGRTIQIGTCVGESRALAAIFDVYLNWLREWNAKSSTTNTDREATMEAIRTSGESLWGDLKSTIAKGMNAPTHEEKVAAYKRDNPEGTNTARSIARDFGINESRVLAHINRNYKNAGVVKPTTELDREVNKIVRAYYASIDRR